MKGLLARLSLVVLASLFLVACASPAPAPTAVPPTKAPAAAPTAAPAAPTAAPAAAPTKAPAAAPTKAPVALTKVTVAQSDMYPYYGAENVAQAAGFYKEEGIDLELILTNSGSKSLAAVVSGSVNIMAGTWSDALNAAAAGQPVVSLMALINEHSYDMVMAKGIADQRGITYKSSDADKIKALKGLKFGNTAPGGGMDQLTRYLLRQGGYDPDRDADIIAGFKQDTLLGSMKNKQIDAFTYPLPATTISVASGDAIYLWKGPLGEFPGLQDFPSGAFQARLDWVQKNEAVVQRFIRASVRASKLIKDDPVRAGKLARTLFPAVDEKIWQIVWDEYRVSFKDPSISKVGFDKNISFMKSAGSKVPATMTLEQVYIGKYVDQAKRDVGWK